MLIVNYIMFIMFINLILRVHLEYIGNNELMYYDVVYKSLIFRAHHT